MRLIVNTNRIIASLIKNSTSRQIITHLPAELIFLDFSSEEINEHKKELLQKSGLSLVELDTLLTNLKRKLIFLGDEAVKAKMSEAKKIMDNIDPDDTPFIAAALTTNAEIWSDDPHFDQQKIIKIWKTKDLIKFL